MRGAGISRAQISRARSPNFRPPGSTPSPSASSSTSAASRRSSSTRWAMAPRTLFRGSKRKEPRSRAPLSRAGVASCSSPRISGTGSGPRSAPARWAFPSGVIARPLDNPLLDAPLTRLRTSTGNSVIRKRDAAREMLRALRRGGAIGILNDQHARPPDAVTAPFFGQPAATSSALAKLADRTEALVIPAAAIRIAPARWRLTFEPALDVRTLPEAERGVEKLTARLNGILEADDSPSPGTVALAPQPMESSTKAVIKTPGHEARALKLEAVFLGLLRGGGSGRAGRRGRAVDAVPAAGCGASSWLFLLFFFVVVAVEAVEAVVAVAAGAALAAGAAVAALAAVAGLSSAKATPNERRATVTRAERVFFIFFSIPLFLWPVRGRPTAILCATPLPRAQSGSCQNR